MLTLLSTIASFLTGGLPKILDLFKDRGDKKTRAGDDITTMKAE